MPLPILPVPARPVDDAIIDTPWGQWAHDTALGVPGGCIAVAQLTAGFAFSTSPIDIPGLAVTFTAAAGRRFKVTAEMYVQTTVTGDRIGFVIANAGGASLASAVFVATANNGEMITRSLITTPAAGPVTYKLRGYRAAGTGSVSMVATASDPAFIIVEDVGPV